MSSSQGAANPVSTSDEVFLALKRRFGFPLPPENLDKSEVGPVNHSYFTETRWLYSMSRRHVNAAVERYEHHHRVDTLIEAEMLKGHNKKSTEARKATILLRQLQVFNEEVARQKKYFKRDGGSIASEASRESTLNQNPDISMPSIPEAPRFLESNVKTGKVSSKDRVMEWTMGGKFTKQGRYVRLNDENYPIYEDKMEVDNDGDDEIWEAFEEEPTEIDDEFGLIPASSFEANNNNKNNTTTTTLSPAGVAAAIRPPQSSSKPKRTKPKFLDGEVLGIPAAKTAPSSTSSADNHHHHYYHLPLKAANVRKDSKNPTKNIPGAYPKSVSLDSIGTSIIPSSTIELSPPSKPVPKANPNWGIYHPKDLSPTPSRPKLPGKSADMSQPRGSFESSATSYQQSFTSNQTSFNKQTPLTSFENADDEDGRFDLDIDEDDAIMAEIHSEIKGKRKADTTAELSRDNAMKPRLSSPGKQIIREERLGLEKGRARTDTTTNYSLGASTERGFLDLADDITRKDNVQKSLTPVQKYRVDSALPECNPDFGPQQMKFWQRFEILRAVLNTRRDEKQPHMSEMIQHTDLDFMKYTTADNLWHAIQSTLFEDAESTKLSMERIHAPTFDRLRAADGDWDNAIQLAGVIHFEKKRIDDRMRIRPTIKLKPLRLQSASCRFWRKYGSHRFLTLRRPKKEKSPTGLKKEELGSAEMEFISNGFTLLHRTWKLFYFRGSKSQTTAQKKLSRNSGFDDTSIVMFAESGPGLETITVMEAIEWFIPLNANKHLTPSKYWSRIALGLSTSHPTIIFDREDILHDLPDEVGVGKKLLTDGCGFASPAAFRAIKLHLSLDYLPAAVQVRIGSAKGLFVPDPSIKPESEILRIRIRPSQAKFKGQDLSDPAHRTLEVLKVSKSLKPASLNIQLIPILTRNGVSKETLSQLLNEDLDTEIGDVFRRLDDAAYVRGYLEKIKLDSRRESISELVYTGSMPVGMAERACKLLESGFSIAENAYLKECFQKVLEEYCQNLKEKLHIKLQRSTVAWCIPDPSAKLEEGQVFLRFSKPFLDPTTHLAIDVLDGDVLVGRNPAHTSSDVQRVTAVDVPELRHYKDVIVFPVKGDRSLASYLSGGDYDGDTVWISWESRLVDPFQNKQEDLPDVDNYFMRPRITSIAAMITATRMSQDLKSFFHGFIRQNMRISLAESKLGICTSMYDKRAYHSKNSIDDDQAKILAQIACRLVDAPKQGDELNPETWRTLEIASAKLREPYYKLVDKSHEVMKRARRSSNVIDHLLFVTAHEKINGILEEFKCKYKISVATDADLTCLKKECDLSLSDTKQKLDRDEQIQGQSVQLEQKKASLREFKNFLTKVGRDLDRIQQTWAQIFYKPSDQEQETEAEVITKNEQKMQCVESYRSILPCKDSQNELLVGWAHTGKCLSSDWALLRASIAFQKFLGERTLVWFLCGEELCILKARATGGHSRIITEPIYLTLQTRKAYMRSLDLKVHMAGAEDLGSVDEDDDSCYE